MSTPSQPLSHWGKIIPRSNRIINAYPRHFLALHAICLFPLFFSLILYLSFQLNLSHPQPDPDYTQILLLYTSRQSFKSIALSLLYALFFFFLSLCAVGSITFSTYHGFSGKPLKLLPAIKSILYSFIPILSTTIASQIVLVFVIVVIVFFVGLVTTGVEILGFEIDYDSFYFIGFCAAALFFLVFVLVCLLANWLLACVIVVAESKWGFEPLRRSFYLARGSRPLSLSLLWLHGCPAVYFVWLSMKTLFNTGGFSGWMSWLFILEAVWGSISAAVFVLHYLVLNTVLYMYCKALHGELDLETEEKLPQDSSGLPFDGHIVPELVESVFSASMCV